MTFTIQNLLYSETNSPRLQYVCQQVFHHWLGLSIEWTSNVEVYRHFKGVKINYGKNTLLNNDFLLPQTALLFENKIKKKSVMADFLLRKVGRIKMDIYNNQSLIY